MSPDHLFTLRVRPFTNEPTIVIHAFEAPGIHYGGTHTRIDVEVRQGGKVVFPRGAMWCGIPGHQSIDGKAARECVLSLVAMKPGDTDAEYFAHYTPEQLEWAERYGEALSCEREARYCDARGAVRE